jgi:hypothetical protein
MKAEFWGKKGRLTSFFFLSVSNIDQFAGELFAIYSENINEISVGE